MSAATSSRAPSRDGTYDILIAGMQSLNSKLTEFGVTVAAMDHKLDDFQEMVQTRYMPRTEVESLVRESQEDRREIRSSMVLRDTYLGSQAEVTRRLERLENGPQRLIGWIGAGIGCCSLLLTFLSILVTSVLWIILR